MGRTKRQRFRKRISSGQVVTIGEDESLRQLVQWMKFNGWTTTVHLDPALFPATGRGLRTKEHISVEEILVKIPCKLLMTVETAAKSLFGWVFERKTFLTQEVLSAHLIFEKHLGDDSFWGKYIASLPFKIATPSFKSSREINSLPSELWEKVNNFNQNVTDLLKEFVNSLKEGEKCPHCSLSIIDLVTTDSFHWAWFIVNSRAVYICPDQNTSHNIKLSDVNCLALAPYLDLFNHSNDAKVQAFVDNSDGSYQIRTLAPFKKYSEVFIHYGDHSNLKLFLEYGFLIPNNIHDTLPLTFDDVYSTVAKVNPSMNISKVVFNFLKSHKLLTNIHLSADGLSWSLKTLVYVLLSSENVDAKTIQLKVYSSCYTKEELEVVSNFGRYLVEQKCSQLRKFVDIMVNCKNEMIEDNVSDSFVMAIDLYKEYLCLLDNCDRTLMST